MKRRTSVFVSLSLFVTPFLFGQESQNQRAPQSPEDLLASQRLVAWSWMQKPRPVPQPLPSPDTPIPQQDQPTTAPANPQNQQERPAQTFTGKIVKDGDKYVLKVAGHTTYQLDGQSNAEQYEDKDVRIVGNLETGSNTIRVIKIELLS